MKLALPGTQPWVHDDGSVTFKVLVREIWNVALKVWREQHDIITVNTVGQVVERMTVTDYGGSVPDIALVQHLRGPRRWQRSRLLQQAKEMSSKAKRLRAEARQLTSRQKDVVLSPWPVQQTQEKES